MELIVYSHGSFGLDNIRRVLGICEYLLDRIPELSILILSDSLLLHGSQIHPGLDYLKIPCLGIDIDKIATNYLRTEFEETVKLRSNLIQKAIADFKPDLVLVDQKPYGLLGELKPALDYLQVFLPQTKLILLLPDILDAPEVTIKDWQNYQYHQAIDSFYDKVLVVGMPELFDLVQEYKFPAHIARKVEYCGYIRSKPADQEASLIRDKLDIQPEDKLVLVTSGDGGNNYRLVHNYLLGLAHLPPRYNCKSLIVCGAQTPLWQRQELAQLAKEHPQIQTREVSGNLAGYIEAADVIVSRGDYNTVCQILSYRKRAVIVPRNKPLAEQIIRVTKMAEAGLFKTISPQYITPKILIEAILGQLNSDNHHIPNILNLDALPYIEQEIFKILCHQVSYLPLFSPKLFGLKQKRLMDISFYA